VALKARGITLIETLIALAILIVIMAIAAPSFTSSLSSARAKSAAQELQAMLDLARSEAIRLTRSVSLCPSTNGTNCTGGSSWRGGWVLFDDVDGDGAFDSGVDGLSVLKVQSPMESTLAFSGPTSVTLKSVGQAKATASFNVTDGALASSTRYVCLLLGGSSSVKTSAC
jgi:type IV fimbrial biogenesis protein FimT